MRFVMQSRLQVALNVRAAAQLACCPAIMNALLLPRRPSVQGAPDAADSGAWGHSSANAAIPTGCSPSTEPSKPSQPSTRAAELHGHTGAEGSEKPKTLHHKSD